jgi:glycosyltransferase involved in cell wall biosynthesis
VEAFGLRVHPSTAISSRPIPSPPAPKRVLLLCPEWPEDKVIASARRAAAVLEALQASYEVEVIVVPLRATTGNPLPSPHPVVPLRNTRLWRWQRSISQRIPRIWQFIHGAPLDRSAFPRVRMRKLAALTRGKHYDLICVMRVLNFPFAHALSRRLGGIPIWLDMDDLESLKNARLSKLPYLADEKRSRLIFNLMAKGYARFESKWFPYCNRLFACSEEDRVRLTHQFPQLDVRVLPNPAPAANPTPPELSPNRPWTYLFFGTLSYPPNYDATIWLAREIWPLMRTDTADVLKIAGRGAQQELEVMLRPVAQLDYVGEVPVSHGIYAEIDVVLVPLRAGAGTRLKVLEAFAARCPVISTEIGVEGIGAEPDVHYLRAETPSEFADQARRLRTTPGLAQKLQIAAIHLISTRHDSATRTAALQP